MKKGLKRTCLAAAVGVWSLLSLGSLHGSSKVEASDHVGQSASSGAWIQAADGRWWYRHVNGGYTVNGWEFINGKWYYFDGVGWMKTGWIRWAGGWYYLDPSGAMANGWIQSQNTWYYLDESGLMRTGWIKDGETWYYLEPSGAMRTGWTKLGTDWYYLDGSGAMKTKWVFWGNGWYYLSESGAMMTGWVQEDGTWYYLDGSGLMQAGWLAWQGEWYYLASSGAMQTGWINDGKASYYLDKESGKMLANAITPDGHYVYPDGHKDEEKDCVYKKVDSVGEELYYRKYYKGIPTEDLAITDGSGRLIERRNKITSKSLEKLDVSKGETFLPELDKKNAKDGFERIGEPQIALDWMYHTFDTPVYGVVYEKVVEDQEKGYGGKMYGRIYSLETGKLCKEYQENLK